MSVACRLHPGLRTYRCDAASDAKGHQRFCNCVMRKPIMNWRTRLTSSASLPGGTCAPLCAFVMAVLRPRQGLSIPTCPKAVLILIPVTATVFAGLGLKEVIGPDDCPPHVRRGTTVEAQSLRRLTEIGLDDIRELLDPDDLIRIKGVEVIYDDLHGGVVPSVIRAIFPFCFHMRSRLKIFTEPLHVLFWVLVSKGGIRSEAQGLVMFDGPGHLRVDIGLDHLCRPVAVIAPHEPYDRDVVQETRQHDLL